MTTRVMPPSSPVSGTTSHVNKAVYTAQPGQTLDINDADAQALAGLGWTVVGSVGPTSARQTNVTPTAPVHVDTTLMQTVVYDGATFRSTTGKAV